MTDKEIIDALLDFNYRVCGETEEQCPISITSREDIDGEQAELVRFTFGELKESCVAIFYSDGTFFTPFDWQFPEWDYNEEWTPLDTTWVDARCVEAIMFNGMPRILA